MTWWRKYFYFIFLIKFCTSTDKEGPLSSSLKGLRDFTQLQFEKFNGIDETSRYVALEDIVYNLDGRTDLYEFSGKYLSIIGERDDLKQLTSLPIVGKISVPAHGLVLTPLELSLYNGKEMPNKEKTSEKIHPSIYVSVRGYIFDVSYGGYYLYGPDGTYHVFAGKDASKALAKMSMESSDVESSEISDLSPQEKESLEKWFSSFQKKYPLVGVLKRGSEVR